MDIMMMMMMIIMLMMIISAAVLADVHMSQRVTQDMLHMLKLVAIARGKMRAWHARESAQGKVMSIAHESRPGQR